MNAAEIVRAYHARTKHHLHRYAAGPETLDWTAQPNPFREYAGSPRVTLPLSADTLTATFAQLYAPPGTVPSQPLSIASLGALLELSFGLSAWKEYGPDRWALRCNPSSGNLHPTETYLICRDVAELDDGVYHYASRDHALERRARALSIAHPEKHPSAWLALSSVHWREAWKYGERAFRYCQLDAGHALGAVRYAAATLGWQAQLVTDYDAHTLAHALGLDRDADFGTAEREEPDLLLALAPQPEVTAPSQRRDAARQLWQGHANVLDAHPMYHWPVIDEVANATSMSRDPRLDPIGEVANATAALDGVAEIDTPTTQVAALKHHCGMPAARIIKQRRSAQHFDGRHRLSATDFFHLLDALLPRPGVPWDVWTFAPRIHPVLFVHRVDGIEPGLYIFVRRADAEAGLRAAMNHEFAWTFVEHCPPHLALYQLAAADCSRVSRVLHCHQAIAATGCFALGMLAEFDALVQEQPWRYRQLHWEAGLLGQVLYLEAESAGLRGTGIGCYFDDAFHELLGLRDTRFQSLYHFTVGRALVDDRITTLSPYPQRAAQTPEEMS